MKHKTIGFIFVAIMLITTLAGCGLVNEIKSVNSSGNAFMTALRDGDHATSWSMLTDDVQKEIGSYAAWQEWSGFRNFDEWNFTNTEIDNGTGQVDGEANLAGEAYQIILIFDKVGEDWRVSGISIE